MEVPDTASTHAKRRHQPTAEPPFAFDCRWMEIVVLFQPGYWRFDAQCLGRGGYFPISAGAFRVTIVTRGHFRRAFSLLRREPI
jgi:hypothetical protein